MDNPHKLPWHIEGEIWKSIPGFQHYEASNLGRIRRIETGRIMQPSMSKGYWHTLLCENGKRSIHRLHKLVCLAFHGQRPDGYVINHKDGNKMNNLPENLEYTTPKGNTHHAIKSGRFGNNIYSVETIQEVVDLLKQTSPRLTYAQIAEKTGVNPRTIASIRNRQSIIYEMRGVKVGEIKRVRRKLSEADISEIRRLLAEGEIPQKEIAARFEVDPAMITRIKNGTRHQGKAA
jgi:hypothetical protein